MTPSYLKLLKTGELEKRIRRAEEMLEPCCLCPEKCGAKRLSGQKGKCRLAAKAIVADFAPHFGEEPPIRGSNGSGTVFFSGCNMHCIYCQNFEISQATPGTPATPELLAFMFLMLQEKGCHNVNLVTPSHIVPIFLQGLKLAAQEGLTIPIVYNSGGYDSVETLRLLDGIVDIYMPDFKYWDEETAFRFSGIRNYPEVARAAITEMHRQTGILKTDSKGVATRGLLVRHLLLPNNLAGTEHIVKFLAEHVSEGTWINIMEQYHPSWKAWDIPPLNRPVTTDEYQRAVKLVQEAGLRLCNDDVRCLEGH